jgi:hypothetical protein
MSNRFHLKTFWRKKSLQRRIIIEPDIELQTLLSGHKRLTNNPSYKLQSVCCLSKLFTPGPMGICNFCRIYPKGNMATKGIFWEGKTLSIFTSKSMRKADRFNDRQRNLYFLLKWSGYIYTKLIVLVGEKQSKWRRIILQWVAKERVNLSK